MNTCTVNRTTAEQIERISEIKAQLGKRLTILGHHYQRDDVIQFADYRGDSLKLARVAEQLHESEYIVFCGVHFMAETADILTTTDQQVILPDLNAGCSMADMAVLDEVEESWEILTERFGDSIIPVTYVNSSAAIKAFVGKHGGLTITSSNADQIFTHALSSKERILFLPDQHLGRNTAYKLGIPLKEMSVYNPKEMELEYPHGEGTSRVILWKGHCSVHQKFEPSHVHAIREQHPEMRVIVHPECMFETVQLADESGSTDYIIKAIEKAPSGSQWAIGTEHNLVYRLAKEHPEQMIQSLNPMVCPCLTMNRIDLPHLLQSLESVVENKPINVIRVPEEIAYWAKIAINRMLQYS